MNEFLNLLSDVWNSGLFGISLGPIISSIFTIIVALYCWFCYKCSNKFFNQI